MTIAKPGADDDYIPQTVPSQTKTLTFRVVM